MPPLTTLAHIIWIRKWWALALWLILALPAGILLSLFNIPATYEAKTIMRFPDVIGAQTNMMRDVSVMQRESIVSTFSSYNVLSNVVKKLNLQFRITTPEKFRKDFFRDIKPSTSLGEGIYSLEIKRNGETEVFFKPEEAANKYSLFNGQIDPFGNLKFSGLELRFTDEAVKNLFPINLEFEYKSLDKTVRGLLKRTKVGTLGSVIYEISYKDRDPYLVAEILNTLREEFLKIYYQTTEVQDVGVLVQMEKDIQVAKEKLNSSEDSLASFYMRNPELTEKPQSSSQEPLSYLQAQSRSEQIRNLKSKLSNLQQAKPFNSDGSETLYWAQEILSLAAEGGSVRANMLKARLFSNNQDYSEKKLQFNATHPQVVAAKKSYDSTLQEIDVETNTAMRLMERELAQTNLLQQALRPKVKVDPTVKVKLELERLSSDNTNNKEIYDRLMASYNKAKLTTGSEIFKVALLEEARPAQYIPPSLKSRLLKASLVVIAIFFLTILLFVVKQIILPSVWLNSDIHQNFKIDISAQISHYKKEPPSQREQKGAGTSPLSWEDREAVRTVREECIYNFPTLKNEGLCLTITSSRPAEGKSFVARQLAESFARTGRRTLLIDADLRKGWQDKVYAVSPLPGLGDLLGPDLAHFTKHPELLFQETGKNNLYILTKGETHHFFSDHLENNQSIPWLMNLVKTQFQVVIIDTPPVLLVPDAHSFITRSHGVVAIVRSGVTRASEAKELKKIIDSRNRTLTFVLNGVKHSAWSETHSKKYHSYYGT